MYLSENRAYKTPVDPLSQDGTYESFVLSKIPVKKYIQTLVLSGETNFHFPKKISKTVSSYNFAKVLQNNTGLPSVSDEIVKKILTICEASGHDLIIICDLLYREYIGESRLLCCQIISEQLDENGFLLSVHEENRYSIRFPLFIIEEYYFDFNSKRYLLEIYTK